MQPYHWFHFEFLYFKFKIIFYLHYTHCISQYNLRVTILESGRIHFKYYIYLKNTFIYLHVYINVSNNRMPLYPMIKYPNNSFEVFGISFFGDSYFGVFEEQCRFCIKHLHFEYHHYCAIVFQWLFLKRLSIFGF